MGRWAWRKVDQPQPHEHDCPDYDGTIQTGDVWACDCGSFFEAVIKKDRIYSVSYVAWIQMSQNEINRRF